MRLWHVGQAFESQVQGVREPWGGAWGGLVLEGAAGASGGWAPSGQSGAGRRPGGSLSPVQSWSQHTWLRFWGILSTPYFLFLPRSFPYFP